MSIFFHFFIFTHIFHKESLLFTLKRVSLWEYNCMAPSDTFGCFKTWRHFTFLSTAESYREDVNDLVMLPELPSKCPCFPDEPFFSFWKNPPSASLVQMLPRYSIYLANLITSAIYTFNLDYNFHFSEQAHTYAMNAQYQNCWNQESGLSPMAIATAHLGCS